MTPVLAIVSGGLLLVGVFHSLRTPGVRGAVGGLVFLVLLVLIYWYCVEMHGYPFDPERFRIAFPAIWNW